MTQWYRQLLDLTYPITSMFTGKGFNQTIIETFGDVYIEDLWIPYFTLTTDISASCSRIHTNGIHSAIVVFIFCCQCLYAIHVSYFAFFLYFVSTLFSLSVLVVMTNEMIYFFFNEPRKVLFCLSL